MKRLYHFSVRTARRTLIILIILTGILIIAGRLLAPLAAGYRADVAQWASDLLGQPVEIGRLKGTWRGLGPELVLYDLQLLNRKTNKATLYLEEVRISIGLVDSLRRFSPVVRKVSFISPRLRVTRQLNGAITIGNLDQLEQSDGSSAFLLPTHLSLIGGEVIWDDLTAKAPPLRLTDVNLHLRNGGARHQLNGSVTLPGKQHGTIELSIDMNGQLDRIETWSARSFMQSRGIDLAFLLNRRIAKEYRFSNNQADVMLWGEWNSRGLVSLEGTTEWDHVVITRNSAESDGPASRLELDKASGAVRIQRLAEGWQMNLSDLQVQRKGAKWPKAHMGVIAKKDPDGNWQITAGSSHFRLEDIHAISTLFPGMGKEIEQTLNDVDAQGSLNNLRLRYQQKTDGVDWAASGEISALHSRPLNGIPGISNLPFKFWLGPNQGTLALDARDVTLDFADLFRDPLILKQLTGDLTWKTASDGTITLNTDQLFAANDDIRTVSRMRMDIPSSSETPLFLDLQSDYWDGDAITTHRYLPAGIMGENVVAWLDRSIGEGHVTEGSVVVRGPLRDFPFHRTHSGRFEVFFNVENLKLGYWPDWPALNNLSADVRFLNNSFDTWASSGEILDSQLQSAHASIKELSLTSPLELSGRVKGPFHDNLRLLTESPLKEDFGPLVKDLKGEGEAQLELDFSLPIDDGSPFTLAGKLEFLDSTLNLTEWQLALNNIQGNLQFDQDHIFASGIKGKALGLPISVDVSTPKNNSKATRISAHASISSKTLQDQFPAQDIQALLTGQSQWKMDLDIPHLSAGPNVPTRLVVTSDLLGSRIDLPEPLGKTAEQSWPFQLKTQVSNSTVQQFDIRYNDQIKLALALNRKNPQKPQLTHVGVALGDADALLPKRNGIEIRGKLKELDLMPWLSYMPGPSNTAPSQLPLNNVSLEIDNLALDEMHSGMTRLLLNRGETHWEGTMISDWAEGGILYPLEKAKADDLTVKLKKIRLDPWLEMIGGQKNNSENTGQGLRKISVTADQLSLKAITITDFSLNLNKQQNSWQGNYRSNRFDGTIVLPHRWQAEPIRLDLNQLNLTIDDSLLSQKKASRSVSKESIDPTQLPAIEIQAKSVSINEKPFGTLQIITQRRESGIDLQTASLKSDRAVLSATGSWLLDAAHQSNTAVDLSLSSRALGSVLKDLALSDNLREAPVEIDSRIRWTGTPLDFSSKNLNGQISMQVANGRFLKVDPGVGRLFALFNLGALKRRLTLDFSDIFKKGYSFDSITGSLLLDSGDAYTNDFAMKGPSANIELSGRIGLGDEDFDALVTITPKISSSIPIAGAIAGGPAVGAALFIAQQLMGESFDKVTQLQYLATGSWDNPVLTPKGRENTETENQATENKAAPYEPPEIDPTIDLQVDEEPQSATENSDVNPQESPSETETDEKKTNKASRFFSRLLEKLKPTGPKYKEAPGDFQ